MKILWQAYDRADYTGGPIINTIRLLPELKKKGYEVIAIIGQDGTGHPNADRLQQDGIECSIYRIPKYSEDHTNIFLKALKQYHPDIFVSNISVQAGFAGRWAQQWGIPVIHTHRSNDALNCGTAEFFFAGPPEWRLTALVCVNNYLLDKIKKLNSKGFISRVIPSGVPIQDRINDQERVNQLKIVYSGRLVQEQKRLNDVLSSFITTSEMLDNALFTIIGSGDYRYLEQLRNRVINSGISHRIKFSGRLLEDEYYKELRKHHVIVLLSDYEGIPSAIMDGMACGLVPVVLNTNGINELITDHYNGIIIDDRKYAFQKAIHDLSQNHGFYKELSYNARHTIVNHFSLAKTVSQWEDLFKEVLRTSCTKISVVFPNRIDLPEENNLLIQHRIKPSIMKRISNLLK